VLACYAAALREGWPNQVGGASGSRSGRQASTIRAALDGVAQTFRANQLGSPVHDARGRFDSVLAAQLRGYAIEDPETKQSQALPAAVVSIVEAVKVSEMHRAVGQLVVGAFFFAMRACEFSDVGAPRRTRIITIGDVEFRKDGRKVNHDRVTEMEEADTVSITFRTQKNGEKGTTVTQHKTTGMHAGGTSGLCPVTALARLVERVRSYQIADLEWAAVDQRPISLVATDRGSGLVTSQQVLHHLRAAALQYGEQRLGFPISKIGTHSLRAGAATAMFLAGVPAETIQLIGRWRSQTFLRYIRIQVQQLTRGVATNMTTNPNFFTIGQE
jgi:hypothetical protein